MSTSPKTYQEYGGTYITLLRSLAIAEPPIRHGPFTHGDASSFRRSFYRLRDALRISLRSLSSQEKEDSYPVKLYEQVSILSAKIEPCAWNSIDHYVIFDMDPVIRVADYIDPQNAQMRQIRRASFLYENGVPRLATPISEPLPDEFVEQLTQENIKNIDRKRNGEEE